MARITYTIFPGLYEPGAVELTDGSLTSGTPNTAVFTDFLSGDKIIFEGKGLKYDDGMFAGGTLTKVLVADASGEKYQQFDGLNIKANLLSNEDIISQINSMGNAIFEQDIKILGSKRDDVIDARGGNDFLLGRGGEDMLIGGAGGDILVGGGASDTFVFYPGSGRDTIRDFDADGSDGQQDFFQADFLSIESMTRAGRNTVIDFGGGDTVTLLDVKPGQIDQTDFDGGLS